MELKELVSAVKGAAGHNRLRILNMLAVRDMCVCELAFVLEISQPSVSRHLKKLISAGFIDKRQNGRWTDYTLMPRNSFAARLLLDLDSMLAGDGTAAADRERMKESSREKICGAGE